jgi:hypothetical protein
MGIEMKEQSLGFLFFQTQDILLTSHTTACFACASKPQQSASVL